ncbi:MAG: sulfatase-like hydrolase/transferase [Rhizomicrobium sp.]
MQSRRNVLKGAAAAAAFAAAARGEGQVRRPNIVFILADDLGYADLSCYGQPDFETPAIDSLAADGLKLAQAYANSAVCSATRTALITGRYQYRLPVGLEEPVPENSSPVGLPPGHPTLPSLLRRVGYRTALVGKWHLGAPPHYGPRKSGYDEFFGFYGGATDYFAHRVVGRGAGEEPYDGLYENDRPVSVEGYLTDVLTDRAAAYIARQGKRGPFFLSLHYNAPHWPWEGPADGAVPAQLKSLRDEDGGNLAIYAAMVRSMDAGVGRILAALQAAGIADDTIVVFTSDNGGERFSDTWPFTGMKGELLEGGLRVPALLRWPGRIAAGSRSDQVTVSMDWLPTLTTLAQTAPSTSYPPDGEDLSSIFVEEAAGHGRTLFWRYRANDQAAMRDGDLKYLKLGGREYLFDVAADQRERANLAERLPDRFARMKAAYSAWNATMLPYPAESFSETPKGHVADRY